MLNEQLTCMTPFSHIDQPGLSWRTEGRREDIFYLAVRFRQIKSPPDVIANVCCAVPSRERKPSLFPKGWALWSNRLSRLEHKQKDPFATSAALRWM